MLDRFTQGKQPKVKDEEGAFSFNHYVISGLIDMRAAKANKEMEKYFSIFSDTLQALLPFIPEETRKLIQKDHELLYDYETALEREVKENRLNAETASALLLKSRLAFAKDKMHYLMMAIPNAGIYKRDDEGVISFDQDSLPFDVQTRIVRATTGGMPAQGKAAVEDHDRTTQV